MQTNALFSTLENEEIGYHDGIIYWG